MFWQTFKGLSDFHTLKDWTENKKKEKQWAIISSRYMNTKKDKSKKWKAYTKHGCLVDILWQCLALILSLHLNVICFDINLTILVTAQGVTWFPTVISHLCNLEMIIKNYHNNKCQHKNEGKTKTIPTIMMTLII